MMGREAILFALVGVLALTAPVSADIMSVGEPNVEFRPPGPTQELPAPLRPQPSRPAANAGLGQVSTVSFQFWPEGPDMDLAPAREGVPWPSLTERHGSLELCLYALMGLGLCRSAPWMKKLSLAGVPEWYHTGGPLQIGHSLAIPPDCLCAAQVSFVQPDSRVEDAAPEHRGQMRICLWRKSQFIPTILASRGPPSR